MRPALLLACAFSCLTPSLSLAQTPPPSETVTLGPVTLGYDARLPQLRFAAGEIRAALAAQGAAVRELSVAEALRLQGGRRLILRVDPRPVEQAYSLRRQGDLIEATGSDANGALYAGLDLAEAIRTGSLGQLPAGEHKPHIAKRGIKFNIPLDARTPSYSDNADSAQQNIPEMWSFDFWRTFLDNMARHRYNVLTLWSLHPFPSIVRVPEYPEVALEDVKRSTVKFDDTYSHTGNDMVRPEVLAHLETVRRMSIGEKIRFWRDVMQYAQERGIEVYWFTWNIFTYGAAGKHGITQSQDNPITIDYFRKSVRETVLTYPLLAGIGITAGEQMEARTDEFSKEKWLWKTYGEGIRDALSLQPGRPFRLIHRYHQTAQSEILHEFRELPAPMDLSFKYAIAHMYSMTKPPFIESALPHLGPGSASKLRSWLTVRNDDIYSFRWADPEFAREFIRHIPGQDKVAGFYMGPDGFNWGRDFLSRHAATPSLAATSPQTDTPPQTAAPPQTVIEKQWLSFLLWGRLSYDPDLPVAHIERIIGARFPQVPAADLLSVWSRASQVIPEITRFSWGDIDLRWFPEASLSHRRYKGFYTVRHFIEGETMPGSGNLDILTWRSRLLAREPMNGKTPLEVAAALKGDADAVLPRLGALRRAAGSHQELLLTLGDLEAMSHLGNYYAEKILGAADLALFDKTAKPEQQASAIAHLQAAHEHWRRYAAIYSQQYKPQLLNRVGYVDIPTLLEKAAADIATAQSWKPGTVPDGPRKRGGDRPFRP